MARKRVRMIDVAAAAGVSPTTASFVLNGRNHSIPATTRSRVEAAARQLGYYPHSAARALATGRTNRIGVVLNTPESFAMQSPYISQVLGGIVRSAPCYSCNLLLHTGNYPDWRALERDILGGSTDGIILVGRYAEDRLTAALLEAEFPSVCVSYSIDHPHCHAVDCDNEAAGYLAVKHLLELGHKDIACIYPGQGLSWGRERLDGAVRAMEQFGLSPDRLVHLEWREHESQSDDWYETSAEHLASLLPDLTGVVCCEETRAAALAGRLANRGIRVPDDLSIVGVNSTEVSAHASPPLTSIHQPLQEIGAAAMHMVAALINGHPVEERVRRLPVRLDIRMSTAPPGAAALK